MADSCRQTRSGCRRPRHPDRDAQATQPPQDERVSRAAACVRVHDGFTATTSTHSALMADLRVIF